MRDTIEDLRLYAHDNLFGLLTEEDYSIMERIFANNTKTYWRNSVIDICDAAFMNALTSKAGLPYQAKLIALERESKNGH